MDSPEDLFKVKKRKEAHSLEFKKNYESARFQINLLDFRLVLRGGKYKKMLGFGPIK